MKENHNTIGKREGDIITYTCPICEYKIVFKESVNHGEILFLREGDNTVSHSGSISNEEIKNEIDSLDIGSC